MSSADNDNPNAGRPSFQGGGFLGSGSFVTIRAQSEVEILRAKTAQYEAFFKAMTEKPYLLATVQKVHGDNVLLVGAMGKIVRGLPPSLSDEVRAKIRPGATVAVLQQEAAIIGVIDWGADTGNVARVKSVLPPDRVMIESPTGLGLIAVACDVARVKPDVGSRVVLDMTNSVAIEVVPEPENQRFSLTQETGVEWGDIGGQDDAKKAMREAIEGPFMHADLYRKYGKKPLKGVLLYGPPGNGKTMLGKAAATAIASVHGARHPGAFMYVKGPEVLNKFLGESEATIRSLFDAARAHFSRHGYPAVIFIDEADSLLSKRGSARGQINSLAEVTVVPQFLAEMDGLDEQCALVILATNLAEVLDPAIVRDGRVGRKVHVPRPDRKTAAAILRGALSKVPISDPGGVDLLVEFVLDRVFSNLHVFVEFTVEKDGKKETHPFTLQHLVSGAMLVGLVDKATTAAIERELANKKGPPIVGGGLTRDDVGAAIKLTVKENRGIDHTEAIGAFLMELRDKVVVAQRKIDDPVH